jgi:hypothetical protein
MLTALTAAARRPGSPEPRMTRSWRWPAVLCAGALAMSAEAQAQQVSQDDLDLQGRANLVQGAGARALGMGGAFLARADDGTAASWNPAGLSYLRVPEVTVAYSGAQIRGTETFTTDGMPARRRDFSKGSDPDFLAATWPFTIGTVTGSAQISYQRMISFTFNREITETLPERFITSDGGFDVVALGTGWQIRPSLRVGATVNRWFGGYHHAVEQITAQRGFRFQEADFRIKGWNVNLGAIWTPRPSFSLGAVYKTPFDAPLNIVRFRSDAVPPSINAATSTFLGLNGGIRFPAAYGAGLSWRPRNAVTLSADYTLTDWSIADVREYFRLGVDEIQVFDELPYPTFDGRTELAAPGGSLEPCFPEDPGRLCFPQHDTHQVRAGIEYIVLRSRVKIPIRAGVLGDRQYVNTVNGGAPWFVGVSAGTGLIVGPVLMDVAYLFARGEYRDIDRQNVEVRAHRFVASLIYRHGSR